MPGSPADALDRRIGALRDFAAQAAAAGSVPARALLAHGREWAGAPLPSRYSPGPAKACFHNAWASASRSARLAYCEGWATPGLPGLDIPMEHAWLVDVRTGTVIERTWAWDPREPCAYLGLAIPLPVVREARRRASASVLFGDWARAGWFHERGLTDAVALTESLPGGRG